MENTEEHILEISETLRGNLEEVQRFEDSLVSQLGGIGILSPQLVYNLRLAFHEAIVNVVVHTYGGEDSSKNIDVRVIVSADRVLMVIRDYGERVDVEKIKSRDLEDLHQNGLGVYFYKTLMDQIEYDVPEEGSGNVIRLIKGLVK